jgi:hypothetical protein
VSGGGLKDEFYKLVKQDSRNASWLGNAIGWQGLEDEGKYNTENPGHAVGKAAQTFATMYLGGLLGDAAGAGSGAGNAAAPVIDESAGLLMNAGSNAATLAEQQAAEQALQQAMQQSAQNLPQGLANTLEAGTNTGALDTGYTPSSLLNAFKNANSANGTPLQSNLLNYGKQTANGLLNGGGGKGAGMAQQMGMKMLLNQQQPQQPMAPPPRQQGPVEPLPRPYNQGPYGTSSGNSMGMPSMDEEMKKKLRAMGYPV